MFAVHRDSWRCDSACGWHSCGCNTDRERDCQHSTSNLPEEPGKILGPGIVEKTAMSRACSLNPPEALYKAHVAQDCSTVCNFLIQLLLTASHDENLDRTNIVAWSILSRVVQKIMLFPQDAREWIETPTLALAADDEIYNPLRRAWQGRTAAGTSLGQVCLSPGLLSYYTLASSPQVFSISLSFRWLNRINHVSAIQVACVITRMIIVNFDGFCSGC